MSYPEWRRSYGRLNVSHEPEYIQAAWGADITVDPRMKTGRVRVIIEGEELLVYELLGRNFGRRWERITEEHA